MPPASGTWPWRVRFIGPHDARQLRRRVEPGERGIEAPSAVMDHPQLPRLTASSFSGRTAIEHLRGLTERLVGCMVDFHWGRSVGTARNCSPSPPQDAIEIADTLH